jgi:hypothetical protein
MTNLKINDLEIEIGDGVDVEYSGSRVKITLRPQAISYPYVWQPYITWPNTGTTYTITSATDAGPSN